MMIWAKVCCRHFYIQIPSKTPHPNFYDVIPPRVQNRREASGASGASEQQVEDTWGYNVIKTGCGIFRGYLDVIMSTTTLVPYHHPHSSNRHIVYTLIFQKRLTYVKEYSGL